MFAHEGQRPDQRSLLQSQLSQRLARLRRRGERLREGWDVNTLALLGDDAGFLAAALRRSGSGDVADALAELEAAIAPLLDPPRTPDQASLDRLAARLETLARFEPATPEPEPSIEDEFPLLAAVAPAGWRSFAEADPSPAAPTPLPAPPQPPMLDEEEGARLEALIAAAAVLEQSIAADGISNDAYAGFGHAGPPARAIEAAPPDTLEARLRAALDGDGLELMFQPIVPLHGEAREQFQALLRLRGGDGRLYTAADLIPTADRAGLLGAIDRWALERCIALIAQRMQAGRAMRLFVNQSLHSVRNAWAATRIERLLGEYRIGAQAISLELRADEADLAPIDVVRYAHAVKALGCGFVLSAFEAGETGERLLAALPFDAVRLSPRHLQLADAAAREELRALVERLHEQGRRVIAPRVEDARIASALWSAGVDYVQGNFVQPADSDLGFDFRGSVV
jgi:EAL domain-containing protein (putative c-di-GMP-specific phosphodiesterase class I)